MSYKIFRIASPVGYGMPQDKIFSVFVNNAADGKELKVYGNGKRIQNYIDTRDVARAVECGLLVDHLNGVYLISGNSIGDLELARECVAFFNRGASIIVDGNKIDSDYERWDLSGKKAEKELGYISIKSIFDSMEYVRGKQ